MTSVADFITSTAAWDKVVTAEEAKGGADA
jgi:hypothetical protein